jgi:hypothetical protein
MASLKFDLKAKRARVFFRFGGRQFNKTLAMGTAREAERLCALIEETIQDLERGKLTMPPEADPAAFILSGERWQGHPVVFQIRFNCPSPRRASP